MQRERSPDAMGRCCTIERWSSSGKWRAIDLMNEARKPLHEYLIASGDADWIMSFHRSTTNGSLRGEFTFGFKR